MTTLTNLPFRRLCVGFGADITTTEMALCGNLLDWKMNEWSLLRRHPSEKLFGVQIASGRADEVEKVCKLLQAGCQVDFIDLNAGCPIDAINKAGAGANLLTHVGRLKRLSQTILDSITSMSLVVKIRVGDHEATSHRLIPQLQQLVGKRGNRVNGVVIHGRTKVARYSTQADWK